MTKEMTSVLVNVKRAVFLLLLFLVWLFPWKEGVSDQYKVWSKCSVEMKNLGLCLGEENSTPPLNDIYLNRSGFGMPADGSIPDPSEKIELLARSFMVSKVYQDSGFAHYTYVLLDAATQDTRQQRHAIARALFCLFDDVFSIGAVPVARDSMAILYVPVRSEVSANKIGSSADILSAYDYSFATFFRRKLQERLGPQPIPRLALVGSKTPIFPQEKNEVDLQIVDLGTTADRIEQLFLSYRDALTSNSDEIVAAPEILYRLRKFFRFVGSTVASTAEASSGRGEGQC